MAKKTTPTKPKGQRREPVQRLLDLARATNLALAGATYKQIAAELEVDEETVRYHLMSPEGQRALRYAVNELQDRTDRFLASAHLQAIRRLVREMEEAVKPSDRIRAAQAITMLAAKRIEISGVNGGPIEVDHSTATLLDERIARMRERSRLVIDTTGTTESPDEEAQEPKDPKETKPESRETDADNANLKPLTPLKATKNESGETREPLALASASGPDAELLSLIASQSDEPPSGADSSPAPRPRQSRQPASLRPGQGFRATR